VPNYIISTCIEEIYLNSNREKARSPSNSRQGKVLLSVRPKLVSDMFHELFCPRSVSEGNASSVSSFNYKLINTDLKFELVGKP